MSGMKLKSIKKYAKGGNNLEPIGDEAKRKGELKRKAIGTDSYTDKKHPSAATKADAESKVKSWNTKTTAEKDSAISKVKTAEDTVKTADQKGKTNTATAKQESFTRKAIDTEASSNLAQKNITKKENKEESEQAAKTDAKKQAEADKVNNKAKGSKKMKLMKKGSKSC